MVLSKIKRKLPGVGSSGKSKSEGVHVHEKDVHVHESDEKGGKSSKKGGKSSKKKGGKSSKSTASKVLTYMTLGGLGMATVGAIGQYVLDKRKAKKEKKEKKKKKKSEKGQDQTINAETATVNADDVTVTTDERVEADVDAEVEAETTTVESDDGTTTVTTSTSGLVAPAAGREYPRVAPLVGMSALVGIRLLLEKLRGKDVLPSSR